MKKKYELLAPAGDFPSLRAAIEAGANAVYFGLQDFNMRFFSKNFALKDIAKIKEICSKNGNVKMYLTLNTIVYDDELKALEKVVKKVKGGVDAIICWDLAVIKLCRKYGIPFHVSTQASVSNVEAAKFYKKLGAERIILARELNLKQIKKISKIKGIEIECFVHGAMCVSVSGRCFTSQFLFNKSANRGECIHPCRRAYSVKDEEGNELKLVNNRVMSAKDLCTLPFIEKMKKAGVKSFKIEGRNRPAEYVYNVTKVYRKALDKKLSKPEIKQAIDELKKVYNRGFSSGFYIHAPTSDDFSYSENGEQTETKKYVGRIEKYWPKSEAISLRMHAGRLKVGDEVYVIGNETGIKKFKIESMEKKNKPIKSCKKGDDVGVKFPKCKKGDEVYLIIRKG